MKPVSRVLLSHLATARLYDQIAVIGQAEKMLRGDWHKKIEVVATNFATNFTVASSANIAVHTLRACIKKVSWKVNGKKMKPCLSGQ